MRVYQRLCRLLDGLYWTGGLLAAGFLVAILLLIVAQMVSRWLGIQFSGAPNYAGYCMAAASFLAFAHALARGAHIRVSLLLNSAGRFRFWLEVWCFLVGSAVTTYLAWYAVRGNMWSHKFKDVSQGQDATPLWIPQLGMSIGAILLAVCLWDFTLRLLIHRQSAIESSALDNSE